MAECAKYDLVERRARWIVWGGIPFALVVAGLFVDGQARAWLWTPAFVVGGTACVFNAATCGWMHCYTTGPLYLIAAMFSLLQGVEVIVRGSTWILVGIAVGTAVAYQIEGIRGRYPE